MRKASAYTIFPKKSHSACETSWNAQETSRLSLSYLSKFNCFKILIDYSLYRFFIGEDMKEKKNNYAECSSLDLETIHFRIASSLAH
jgi:hypothetical protein